jgi:hypothetical protein
MTAPVLSATQVSQRWGGPQAFPVRRVCRWCERGVFPRAFKVGNRWVIPETDVRLREGTDHLDPTA